MNGPTGKKRILAMALAVAMAASMTNTLAFALEGTQDSGTQDSGAKPLLSSKNASTSFVLDDGDLEFGICAIPDPHDNVDVPHLSVRQGEANCYALDTQFVVTQQSTEPIHNDISVMDTNGNPVKLTIQGLNTYHITGNAMGIAPGGKLELTVSGENALRTKGGAGIYVPAGAELTINAASNTSDSLKAIADEANASAAGIGGRMGGGAIADCGKITILGGKIDIDVNGKSAALGAGADYSGNSGKGGDITIGGNAVVLIQGNNSDVGIGSPHATLGTLVIQDNASVQAKSGGLNGDGGSVIIKDNAVVNAQGAGNNAGIGGVTGKSLTSIVIQDNAEVTASGSGDGGGAGIGGGGIGYVNSQQVTRGGDGGNITISGGYVKARPNLVGNRLVLGAAIGGGTNGGSGGNITISGGYVRATGKYSQSTDGDETAASAPIGGGTGGDGGNITISGGHIETVLESSLNSNEFLGLAPALIGGGAGGAAGNIEISGGTVLAYTYSSYYNGVYTRETSSRNYVIKSDIALLGKGEGGAATGSVTITGGNVSAGLLGGDLEGVEPADYIYPIIKPAPEGVVYTPVQLDGKVYNEALITELTGFGDYGVGKNFIADDDDSPYLNLWLPTGLNDASVTVRGNVWVKADSAYGDEFAVGGKVTAGVPALLSATKTPINPTLASKGDVDYTGAELTAENFILFTDGSTGTVAYRSKEQGDPDEYYSRSLPSRAGSYTVKAEIADTLTHMAGSATTDITIRKATVAPLSGRLEVASGNAHTYLYDMSALLPVLTPPAEFDYETTYTVTGETDPDNIITYQQDEKTLSVTVSGTNSTPKPNAATLSIAIQSRNFTDMATTLAIDTVSKKIPVGKPTVVGTPEIGAFLSTLQLSGTMTEQDGTTPVAGTFSWVKPDDMIQSGLNTYGWVFTPADATTYLTVHGNVAVTSSRQVPKGEPGYTPIYTAGKTLADANLNVGTIQPAEGKIEWINSSVTVLPLTTPVTQNASFFWLFTPDDSVTYTTLRGSIVLWSGGGGGGGGGSSSDGDSSGGGGSSTSNNNPDATSANVGANGAVNSATLADEATSAIQALLKAAPDKPANVSVLVKNAESISPAALKQLADAAAKAKGTVTLNADTTENGAVVGRLYIDPAKAANLKNDVKLSISTSGSGVTAVKNHFEKYFSNEIAVVSFAQQSSFGMQVDVAVRANLTGIDVKNMRLYSFDRATNKCYPISTAGVLVDENGYLYFSTTHAGDIIISNGPLKSK